MGAIGDLLGQLDPDPGRRGSQFERICKWFLTNDPLYKSRLRHVWLWKEWPDRWSDTEAGIDLVAEDFDGQLWAIQAKAYDQDRDIPKRELDKFLSESNQAKFSQRLLIATTDGLHHIARRTMAAQEKDVSFIGLSDLREADEYLDWPVSPDDLRPSLPPTPGEPRDYQRVAINDVVAGFEKADRGQLVMACGTGKTLTSLFIKEALAAGRTLVLLPSLSLLKQTLRVWSTNMRDDFAYLPVCSDPTVSRGDDAAVMYTSDLGVPVTTDPAKIAQFLRRRGPRVVFSTYQSSPQIAAAFSLGRVPAFDLVIADEAHRCAGPVSSDFATILDPAKIKAKHRLFMTATPRYFTGKVIRQSNEVDFAYASMDDEGRFGPVFHRLGFSDAIKRGLLTDYQVVVIGVDDATYRGWAEKGTLVTLDGKAPTNARTLAGQIGLAKAMRKYNLRRTISFHSRVSSAKRFTSSMNEVLAWMPPRQRPTGRLWAEHASGEMSAGERGRLIQWLSQLGDGERGLLANARCLAEGVDVPTLDGVAFIDPRRSEIDIVQAVGRAIRRADDKSVGTIVIPVFVDNESNPQVALNDSAFKPVWDVIKALRSHDDEIGERLDELRRQLGECGGIPLLPSKIRVDLPKRVGKEFAAAFGVRLVEQTTMSWEFWFGLLERYLAENGTAQVNKGYRVDGYLLGGWCVNQRVKRKRGQLTVRQIARLDSLHGWAWDRHDSRWEIGFEHLSAFIEATGHSRMAASEKFNGYALGSWMHIQRRDFRSGKLPEDRRNRLDAVTGWLWSVEEPDPWGVALHRLHQYVDVHGDSLVAQGYQSEDGFRLGAWVNFQRTRYNQGKLEKDRIDRLALVSGWVWGAADAKWEKGFKYLCEFAGAHGTVRVPSGYEVDGFKLRTWYANQRNKFDRLSEDRRGRLQKLPGWDVYSQESKWETGFQRLLEYVEEYGNSKVERPYVVDGYPLGAWAGTQRQDLKNGRLSQSRVDRLEALPGWAWNRRDSKWDKAYERLVRYLTEHGDTYPTLDYADDDGFRLGAWVHMQRQVERNGKLAPARRQRLNEIDSWEWNPRGDKWSEGFRRLTAYLRASKNDLPHSTYTESDGYRLGPWAAQQRSLGNAGKLSQDRWDKLNALKGWQWSLPRGAAGRRN
jgi:superfamily II DNA or RNA helicase